MSHGPERLDFLTSEDEEKLKELKRLVDVAIDHWNTGQKSLTIQLGWNTDLRKSVLDALLKSYRDAGWGERVKIVQQEPSTAAQIIFVG